MKYVAILSIGCLYFTTSNAQTNVYQCAVDPSVTQAEIDANDYYSDGCITFDQSPYNFDLNDNKTAEASKQIDIEPDFTAQNFLPNEGMSLLLCDDLRDVVSFSHSDLSSVEALKKFEVGIGLPEDIELRIQDFINSGDTSGNQINPYLEWHLNAEAIFMHRATGEIQTIDGFYYQEFEREQSDPNTTNWGWNVLPTSHNMRFRFAPPLEGGWDVFISVTLQDGSSFNYCPFVINVTPNTENDGYVKVADNKKVLERNGELFFPIGQDLHWPLDDNGDEYGLQTGAYSYNTVNSRAHVEFENDMVTLKNKGVNSFRMLLNPPSLDIEFEKVGDYTDRLNYGWEIDKIIEKAEELDLYIHFNMLVHYGLEANHAFRLHWDWSKNYVPHGWGEHVGHYGYRDFFIEDDTPELFMSDITCIKYYKQKVRYLIARYGYSTHIYMLELLSEANNVGNKNDITGWGTYNHYYSAYNHDSQQPIRVANWHDIMSKYIKNELNHKQHLVCASYAGYAHADGSNGDYTYSIPEIDVVSWNNYSDSIKKFHVNGNRIKSIQQQYNKPIFWSETGPLAPNNCDNGTTYRKDAWMTGFSGISGFNYWAGAEPEFHDQWEHLGNVRNFIEGTPQVANLFMSNNWEVLYVNDSTQIGGYHWNPARFKEVNYISGAAPNTNGDMTYMKVGVVSNLTDNYFTNISPGDVSSWCATHQPNLTDKHNLVWGDLSVIGSAMGDYFYDWYDYEGNHLSSTTYYLHDLGYFPHPLSCVESNCNTPTSEIPFVLEWDYSNIYKSNLTGTDNQNNTSILKEISTIQVYPNPTSDFIIIQCTDRNIIKFQLFDAKGQLIQTLNNEQIKDSISVSNLESGYYVILGLDKSNLTKHRTPWIKL